MGSSNYSDSMYSARMAYHASTKTSAFTHDVDVKSGKVAAAVHELLDPKKLNSFGKLTRESFDSADHPESVPVAVLFDITGSMGRVPTVFIDKLGKLMGALVKKGILEHPQVLFGAFGDATCDRVPLQIGQYESGNEMDEALSKIYKEGGGGGQQTESSELALYFITRKSNLDSVNKRGKKGYLFIISDELPYPIVKKDEVATYIGDSLQNDILFSHKDPRAGRYSDAEGDILAEAEEKFEVFWVMPNSGSYWNDENVVEPMKAIFGQRYLRLETVEDVVELIVSTIGLEEGNDLDTVASSLKDIGADDASIARAANALTKYSASKAVTKAGKIEGDLVKTGDDAVARL